MSVHRQSLRGKITTKFENGISLFSFIRVHQVLTELVKLQRLLRLHIKSIMYD